VTIVLHEPKKLQEGIEKSIFCHNSHKEGWRCSITTQAPFRVKFATQVNSEILRSVRQIAQSEGRQIQALMDEALADLIEKKKQGSPRSRVMAAYQGSHESFAPLYKKLAE